MKRRYVVLPREAVVDVEGRDPFHAERRARAQHPHLRGSDLIIVAAGRLWERAPDRSYDERLSDFARQMEGGE